MLKNLCLAVSFIVLMAANTMAAQSALLVTSADNTSTFSADKGQEVMVSLKSNPTTGYSWQLARQPEIVSQNKPRKYIAHRADVVGGDGLDIFYFKVNQTGQELIKFEYKRPWEKIQTPADFFEFTLTVKK